MYNVKSIFSLSSNSHLSTTTGARKKETVQKERLDSVRLIFYSKKEGQVTPDPMLLDKGENVEAFQAVLLTPSDQDTKAGFGFSTL